MHQVSRPEFSKGFRRSVYSNGNSVDFPGQQFASRVEDLHSKILSIEGMLSRLQRDITKDASASGTVQPPSAGASQEDKNAPQLSDKSLGDSNSKTDKAKSYSDVVGSDLSSVVKCVVTASIKEQKLEEKSNCSVIIFGLEESKNDIKKVYSLLQCDMNDDYIVQLYRIGKVKPKSTSWNKDTNKTEVPKFRPIRVQFNRESDRLWVLQNAGWLIKSAKLSSSVRISKCLNSSELENLRNKRLKCAKMNAEASKCPNGKDRYVVINNEIMK